MKTLKDLKNFNGDNGLGCLCRYLRDGGTLKDLNKISNGYGMSIFNSRILYKGAIIRYSNKFYYDKNSSVKTPYGKPFDLDFVAMLISKMTQFGF